ncbi:hypothetical protein R1sor_011551 [Riccia sorocarpa]|uniref:Uncharacterized protein n=1 Tax=Riccia sorocarpa TaxID=122646 RepID=A0ABD3I529_9MARC
MACSAKDLDGDMDKSSSMEPLELPTRAVNITDLPGVLVSAILTWMSDPIDVASAFVASRIFWSVGKTTPFRLNLRPKRTDNARNRTTWTRSAVAGIGRTMSSTRELDLSECPVLCENIAQLLVDLPNLERLLLDECKGKHKTTSAVDALSLSARSRLLSLILQRCSCLGSVAIGKLFTSTTAVGCRLETLLLSQVGKMDLPQDVPLSESLEAGTGKRSSESMKLVKDVASEVPGPRLRILALNNCDNLGVAELAVIGETCTYLEILMLGGSATVGSFGLLDPETCSSALLMTVKRLHRLRILDITFFYRPVFNTVRGQISPAVHVWDFCEKNSVMAAVKLVAQLKGCSIPFASKESDILSAEDASSLDWCIDTDHDYYKHHPWMVEIKPEFPGESCIDDTRWDLATSDMLFAFKSGVNCQDWSCRTPLHMACAHGDADRVAKLLFIGASAGEVRDRNGGTVLMQAARKGNAQVCDLLLKAGADVLAINSRRVAWDLQSGATPLGMVASLGHTAALEVMIAHCKEHGIDWQNSHIYVSDMFPSSGESPFEALNCE